MGGLLAKELYLQDHQDSQQAQPQLIATLQGILFIATPHEGSHVANIANRIPGIPGADVRYLNKKEAWGRLTEQNERFLAAVSQRRKDQASKIQLRGMYETLETRGVHVVPMRSALLGMDNAFNDPWAAIGGDHLACCKPEVPTDSVYVRISNWIQEQLLSTGKERADTSAVAAPPVSSLSLPLSLGTVSPRPSRTLVVGMTSFAAALLAGAPAWYWRASIEAWYSSREIRIAATEYRSRHDRTAGWDAEAFQLPNGKQKNLGQVLVETTPRLASLHNCLKENSDERRSCDGIVLITAPGGTGKGPLARHLAESVPDATRFDMAWPREDGPMGYAELAIKQQPYVNVVGVLSATLPEHSYGSLTETVSPEAHLPTVCSYYRTQHKTSGGPCGGASTIVIDSFDEVGSATRTAIMEMASRWTDTPGRTVIIFSRSEAARAVIRPVEDSARPVQAIPVEPLFVGNGETLYWYFADAACFCLNQKNTCSITSDRLPTDLDCATYASRRDWSKRILEDIELGDLENLMYAGELGNSVTELLLISGSAADPATILENLFTRGKSRHGRPGIEDPTFAPYFRSLKLIAETVLPRASGVMDLSAISGADYEVSFMSAGTEFVVPVAQVLDYSGLVDPALRIEGASYGYRFFPPLLQALLKCSDFYDASDLLSVDRQCYRSSQACILGCWSGY